MKTTELRIGNLVSYKNEDIVVVDAVSKDFILTHGQFKISTPNIEPIPLTEQWLLDFGFEETIEESFIKESEGATLIIFIINGVGECIFKHYSSYSENDIDAVNAVCLLPVSHVHQLQNLYFALTQEELILKERSKE